ncbi:hypothetical protein Aph01nite_40960 [Acrocarpospora phusangensis]|uniref:Winged helix DNA-binding domain-containing protein n=1 Tax=Acrocarpospora phusangensis TaxID=1070424 RepID=A0A919UL59_9ACTN|nr:winged helix DNA-binding domain-containing protein [Acrocarpospora phusangensis]GIH25786.1 hypothetical protein Aph01nite_40960 [Acrocarpospora phusangensis]
MKLTTEQVLSWRMRRQFLDRPPSAETTTIIKRLCGVQAQVASSAQHAVAVRRGTPDPTGVADRLHDRTIVKTSAMRGTLHLLTTEDAPAYLSLMAAPRTWERGSWQRVYVTVDQLAAITDAAREVLPGNLLTREELTAQIIGKTGDEQIAEHLRSGWGTVLKPLAWQGYLVYGPSDGNRVTFTSPETYLPGWTGLPAPEEAARTVIPTYLGAFGPASMALFDQWLTRGMSKKAHLKSWFADLEQSGTLTHVEVDGEPAYARTEDLDDLAAATPTTDVRLLPAFDQYVLGPGTANTQIIAANRRAEISKTAGWISPVVLSGGRVAGTWTTDSGTLDVVLFTEAGPVSRRAIEEEAEHLGAVLGTSLRVAVQTG